MVGGDSVLYVFGCGSARLWMCPAAVGLAAELAAELAAAAEAAPEAAPPPTYSEYVMALMDPECPEAVIRAVAEWKAEAECREWEAEVAAREAAAIQFKVFDRGGHEQRRVAGPRRVPGAGGRVALPVRRRGPGGAV